MLAKLGEETWVDPLAVDIFSHLAPLSSRDERELKGRNRIAHDAIQDLRQQRLVLDDEIYELRVALFKNDLVDGPHVTAVITFHEKGSPPSSPPRGLWISTVTFEKGTHVSGDILKMSPEVLRKHAWVGERFFRLYDQFLFRSRAQSDSLEAGWVGRLKWARRYRFDPQVQGLENGVPLSQAELMRRNFRRFCEGQGIDLSQLELHGQTLSADLSELKEPADFVAVREKSGRKLRIAPYVDHNTLGKPVRLDVGKAFATADDRPEVGQANRIIVGRNPRSDHAMSVWFGIRYWDPACRERFAALNQVNPPIDRHHH